MSKSNPIPVLDEAPALQPGQEPTLAPDGAPSSAQYNINHGRAAGAATSGAALNRPAAGARKPARKNPDKRSGHPIRGTNAE